MTHSFEHGDHVYVGTPSPRKIHWIFWSLAHQHGMALLKSPMSGRLRHEPLENLTLHSEGVSA